MFVWSLSLYNIIEVKVSFFYAKSRTCSFIVMKIIFDIPYIINKEYFYIKGYTIEQSHGGADVSHERRSIFVKDEDTGKVFEITVFSEYIDENDFLEVEFLPHTKYGAIISREKSR